MKRYKLLFQILAKISISFFQWLNSTGGTNRLVTNFFEMTATGSPNFLNEKY